MFTPMINGMRIGRHGHKSGSFWSSIAPFFEEPDNEGRPLQIFTGAPQFWRRPNPDPEDVKLVRVLLQTGQHNVFIHSIYLINLAKPPLTFKEKAGPCLAWELTFGAKIGFKGVVVHCGKYLKQTPKQAQSHMYHNMLTMLPSIDTTCPLLLETSAGQGSELCSDLDSFVNFYAKFTPQEREKIKLCVDTCHVFAAGHDPFEFIQGCEEAFPSSIALVHFNDSAEPRGAKKDRHAPPGKGHIGVDKLVQVATWCFKNRIPMVVE